MTSTERLRLAIADRYILKGELGAGGMATVYLAEDVRHHRPVALKVLRPELAAVIGAERFLKEIETTANLQHPHILPLFDSGAVDGTVFYVMPFVEGETLRDRIARDKQLPVDDALRIAKEVASALDYAHRRGVIHRDIKPENILLHDGTALVADFGIALAASKTGSTRMTETGMSLGTPHYMSPEQAMGEREITARADVYALGCVLYEMLTGEPPFNGPTAQAIVARVLTDVPRSARSTRATVPSHVDDAISTALSKLPADRFGTAAEFAAALSTPSYRSVMLSAASVPAARTSRTPWIVAGVASFIAIAAVGVGATRPAVIDERPVVRSTMTLSDSDYVTGSIAMSRDGQSFVVEAYGAGSRQLLLRRMNADRFMPIAGTENARFPLIAPDGRRVSFRIGERQLVVPLEGGAPISGGAGSFSSAWHANERIVMTREYNSGLAIAEEEGAELRTLTLPDSAARELGHWHPQFLADGRHVIFTVYRTPVTNSDIEIVDVETGTRTVIVKGANFARVLPSGPLVFLRGNAMFAVEFDARTKKTTGQPVQVLNDVAVLDAEARPFFDFSNDGTLVYGVQSEFEAPSTLEWFDRKGRRTPVRGAPPNAVTPTLSPNGRFVAFALRKDDWDIWVLDLARQTTTRLTDGGGVDLGPAWHTNGEEVLWSAERPSFHLYSRRADAATPAREIVGGVHDVWHPSFTPDGRTMLYHEVMQDSMLMHRRALDAGVDERVLTLASAPAFASVTSDGNWMAYTAMESNRREVYILPYPSLSGRRLQVTSGGGTEPFFVRGGRELLYRNGARVMSISFNPSTGELGAPAVLFQQPAISIFPPDRTFTATADGQRLMLATRPPGTEPRKFVVVSNWFREVREKMAAAR